MAIDSSIALSYQPPQIQVQVPQPLQQFGQILSLQNLMQQRQLLPIELQTKQLQLDQLRRVMQEQQDYAPWLKSQLEASAAQGSTAAPLPALTGQPPAVSALPALTGQAPAASDLMNLPTIDRGAQMASLAAAPDGLLPLPPPATALPAAPSLAAMMTAPAPAPAPAVPAPATALPPSAGGGMNIGKTIEGMLARFPTIGPERAQSFLKTLTDQQDLEIKQHDNNAKAAGELAGIGIAIRDSKDPATQFPQGIWEAVNKKLIPEPVAQQMLADGYDKHKNDIQAFIDRAQTAQTQSEIAKNNMQLDLDNQKQATKDIRFVNNQDDYNNFRAGLRPNVRAHFPATFSPQVKDVIQSLETAPGEAFQQGAAKTAQMAQLLGDRSQIPDFIKQQPAETQPYLQKLYDSGLPLDQFKQFAGMAAVAPKPGETVSLPAGVQEQKVEQAGAIGLAGAQAGIRAKEEENTALAGAVIRDPKLYSKLSSDKQSELQPFLARLGFTNFTQKPSDTELTTLYNNQRNLDAVKAMRDDFNNGKYDWITGPVLGQVKHIPYFGDNGKLLEGKLDELRSTLGDLVKGGTLRSSDIKIYEKMFPNVTDTTNVIKGKLNNLYDRLAADTATYRNTLQSSGRALPDTLAPAGPIPATDAPPAWQSPVKIEIQKPQGSASIQLSPAQQTAVPKRPAPPGKTAGVMPDGKGGWKGVYFDANKVDEARRQGVIVP